MRYCQLEQASHYSFCFRLSAYIEETRNEGRPKWKRKALLEATAARRLARFSHSQTKWNSPLVGSLRKRTRQGRRFHRSMAEPSSSRNKASGKTTISWSTGDGSPGMIDVLMKNLRMQYPASGGEAIEQLETLKAKGGEFLLIRRELVSWLQDYKGLKEHLDRQYRIIQDDDICRIYDLRGAN